MSGPMERKFWLDVNNQEQAVWAASYLSKKGVALDGRYLLSTTPLSQWLKQERERPHSGLLMRMEKAWDQVQRRNADRAKKMKRLNTLISARAMQQLLAFRKELQTTNSNILEILLTAESERAAAQNEKTKQAQEEASQLKSKLNVLNRITQKCIEKLSDCCVLMEDAQISLNDITDEQKSRSKKLVLQRFKDVYDSDLISKLDVLLYRHMDRPQ